MSHGHYQSSSLEIFERFHEELSEHLFARGCLGIEEVGSGAETLRLKVYWPDGADAAKSFGEFERLHPGCFASGPLSERLPQEDWAISWRENFTPLEVGRTFYVRPPWSSAKEGKRNIVIYPGRSFGTGYHESTELALTALEEVLNENSPRSFADVGAGSGILTIAAMHGPSIREFNAYEIDESFQEEIPRNVALSGFDPAKVNLFRTPFGRDGSRTDAIAANITADVLIELKTDFSKGLKKGGRLVLSGIHEIFREEFEREFFGIFDRIDQKKKGEWLAYVMGKRTEG